ncbi:(d)CMP kinase, partial [Listeria monocytogenes]|nr:(d)CMP kinase [Listeria monocytogenes]
PLKKADDAIEVATTSMSSDEVANKILSLAALKINN